MAEQSYKSSLVKDARTGAFSRLDKLPEASLHFTFAEQGDAYQRPALAIKEATETDSDQDQQNIASSD